VEVFFIQLCLYNNTATFTLNGIVFAACLSGNYRCAEFCGTTRTPSFARGGDIDLPISEL